MVLDLCACEEENYKDHLFFTIFQTHKAEKTLHFKHILSTKMLPQVFRKGYKPNLVPFTRIICKEFQQRLEPFP